MNIEIKCTGTELIPLDRFTELQGNLKELSVKNYEKLKQSILKYGFSFPVFCYKENETYYILDAHQRIKTLKKLKSEGYTIPDLPTDFIEADSKKQAKEKLLMLNSNFGKIQEEGLYEFLNTDGIVFDEIKPLLELPNIDLENFELGYFKETKEFKKDDLRPFNKTHILLSFPTDKFLEIQQHLEIIKNIEGIEIEQGSN